MLYSLCWCYSSAEKRALVLDDCSPSELKTKSDQMSEKEQRHSQQQQKPQHPPPTSNNAIICDSGNKITGSTADNTNVVGAPSSLLLSPQSTQLQLANNAGKPRRLHCDVFFASSYTTSRRTFQAAQMLTICTRCQTNVKQAQRQRPPTMKWLPNAFRRPTRAMRRATTRTWRIRMRKRICRQVGRNMKVNL